MSDGKIPRVHRFVLAALKLTFEWPRVHLVDQIEGPGAEVHLCAVALPFCMLMRFMRIARAFLFGWIASGGGRSIDGNCSQKTDRCEQFAHVEFLLFEGGSRECALLVCRFRDAFMTNL